MATHTPTTPSTRSGVTAPSRRELISAAGFTALAGIAAVTIATPDAPAIEMLPTPRGDDAELIALADRFMAIQAQMEVINAADPADYPEAEMDDLVSEQASLLWETAPLEAATLLGYRARAAMLVNWYGVKGREESPHEIEWHRLKPLFRDLLGAEWV